LGDCINGIFFLHRLKYLHFGFHKDSLENNRVIGLEGLSWDTLDSKAESRLIPQKSKYAYKKEYDKFIKWTEEQKIQMNELYLLTFRNCRRSTSRRLCAYVGYPYLQGTPVRSIIKKLTFKLHVSRVLSGCWFAMETRVFESWIYTRWGVLQVKIFAHLSKSNYILFCFFFS
jgi:hypothetical protein